jgi:hypothetical protein
LQGNGKENSKHPGGRPTKYKAGLVNAVGVTMAEGLPLHSACRLFGVHRVTVWRWGKRYPGVLVVLESAADHWKRQLRNRPRRRRKHIGKGFAMPRKYRASMVGMVRPTIRATAAALGVHFATVWRWTRKHPAFGQALTLQRLGRDVERLAQRSEWLLERSGLE